MKKYELPTWQPCWMPSSNSPPPSVHAGEEKVLLSPLRNLNSNLLVVGEGTTLSFCRLLDWRLSKRMTPSSAFTGCFEWTYVSVSKPCRAGPGNPQPGDNLKPVKVFNPACLSWTNYINCINYMKCEENVKKKTKQAKKKTELFIFSGGLNDSSMHHPEPLCTLNWMNVMLTHWHFLKCVCEVRAKWLKPQKQSECASRAVILFLWMWFYLILFFFTSQFLFDADEQVLSHGLHVHFNLTRSTKGIKKKKPWARRESLLARSPARSDRQRSSNWKA